ncbi:ABC transporter substrate-binding protein [Psychroserpens ponticola]|uniref:Helical backbone metal receptor n=1 Tax=Psychroserpens ponticola TaxID=2932268 RepID=A0ABY7S066_9FLAO|nr:helical backbone metal receptor [Psychroserpens ponticola]WCO02673.1 helical backbone metal receptor [Psychroserpens ponticola]
MFLKDQLNRKLQINGIPERIVSLVPSQTELLVDLGLEDAIVGVTKFCIHPKHLQKGKTIVGGTKQVHLEKIKKLNPDVILCNMEENTKEMISVLESIAPVHISDIYTIDDCLELIKMYGILFHKIEKAESIVAEIKLKRNAFELLISNRPKLNVAYFIWKKPWMVAANQTFINEMLSINNFRNVYQDVNRYPEIGLLELKEKLPDVILLSSEPYPFKDSDIVGIKSMLPETEVIIVDGEAFSWYGSRLIKAFDYFKELQNTI